MIRLEHVAVPARHQGRERSCQMKPSPRLFPSATCPSRVGLVIDQSHQPQVRAVTVWKARFARMVNWVLDRMMMQFLITCLGCLCHRYLVYHVPRVSVPSLSSLSRASGVRAIPSSHPLAPRAVALALANSLRVSGSLDDYTRKQCR
jgi:hypothetical protein